MVDALALISPSAGSDSVNMGLPAMPTDADKTYVLRYCQSQTLKKPGEQLVRLFQSDSRLNEKRQSVRVSLFFSSPIATGLSGSSNRDPNVESKVHQD